MKSHFGEGLGKLYFIKTLGNYKKYGDISSKMQEFKDKISGKNKINAKNNKNMK